MTCFRNEKNGVTDFTSEIKSIENYCDFELAHVNQHGLKGF